MKQEKVLYLHRELSQSAVVSVRHLDHFFGKKNLKKQVLFDINLEIKSGEIALLTGPSGSGKTTLLTLIGALRTLKEGSLQVLGQEVVGLSNRALIPIRRNIGFIFQAHNLFESLTASQNVEMSVELTSHLSDKQQRAADMLSKLGLGDRIRYRLADVGA